MFLMAAPQGSVGVQSGKGQPVYTVKEDGSDCRLFDLYVRALQTRLLEKAERIAVVAHLGDGETNNQIARVRLNQIRSWCEVYNINTENAVFEIGDRVKGKGTVEIFSGEQLFIFGTAYEGARLCVGDQCKKGCHQSIMVVKGKRI